MLIRAVDLLAITLSQINFTRVSAVRAVCTDTLGSGGLVLLLIRILPRFNLKLCSLGCR